MNGRSLTLRVEDNLSSSPPLYFATVIWPLAPSSVNTGEHWLNHSKLFLEWFPQVQRTVGVSMLAIQSKTFLGCHHCSHWSSLPKSSCKHLCARCAMEAGLAVPNPSRRPAPCGWGSLCSPRQQEGFGRGSPRHRVDLGWAQAPLTRCTGARTPLLALGGRKEAAAALLGAFPDACPPHSFSPVFLYPGSNRSLWLRRPLWGNSSHRCLPGLPGGGSGRTLRSLLWQWQQQD